MRRFFGVFLAGALCLGFFPSCSSGVDEAYGTTIREERIMLPEEHNTLLGLNQLNGKTNLLLTDDSRKILWVDEVDISSLGIYELGSEKEVVNLDEGERLTTAAMSETGQIAYCTVAEDNSVFRCYVLDVEGIQQDKAIELTDIPSILDGNRSGQFINNISSLEFIGSDSLLLGDSFGNLVRVDLASSQKEAEFCTTSDSFIVDHAIIDDNLIAIVSSAFGGGVEYSAQVFSVESGEPLNSLSSIEQAITSILPTGNTDVFLTSPPRLTSNGNQLYMYSGDSIYRIDESGVPSVYISGENNNLSNTAMIPSVLLHDNEAEGMFVLYSEPGNLLSPSSLYAYKQSDEGFVSGTLSLYMLEDNPEIQRAISSFREQNKDLRIEAHIGIPKGSALTAEEAIKQLNADILSGEGPDIMVLDGLSVSQLQDQNILMDIAGIADVLERSDAEYFDKVLRAYQGDDGTCYAIPTRFTAPSIFAEEKVLDEVASLEDLANLVLSYEGNDALSFGMTVDLATLFAASYPNIVLEDGTINKEGLTAFFEKSKSMTSTTQKILDSHMKQRGSEGADFDYIEYSLGGFENDQNSWMGISSVLDPEGEKSAGEVGIINSPKCFNEVALTEYHSQNRFSFGLLKLSEKQVFTPHATLGITTACNEMNAARSFVEFVLSEEQQSSDQKSGFPVSKAAFFDSIQYLDEPETVTFMGDTPKTTHTFAYGPLTNEEVQGYMSLMEEVETVYASDRVITTLVKKELEAYIRGQKSLEEAVDTVSQKTSLYLLE